MTDTNKMPNRRRRAKTVHVLSERPEDLDLPPRPVSRVSLERMHEQIREACERWADKPEVEALRLFGVHGVTRRSRGRRIDK